MTEKIGNVSLNLDYYEGQDLYSDGTVEEELLEAVKIHSPEEFPELICRKGSWPFLYHLSEQRANIIDWYPIKEGASVLEVGAGCGAVTGALTRLSGRVVANDLSKRRSLINAWRNRDAKNLEIMVGNFNTVADALKERFDYITLIGVFEYAESYIQEPEPGRAFLEKINRLLSEDGEILIAIENRLGLKYFAGCMEDHKGRVFEGIEGYPCTEGVRTYSKGELEQLLKSSGFTDYEFYYPYPDYKLPTSVYSDERQPGKGELLNNIRNFDGDRYVLFDEGKAFDSMAGTGDFPVFSNSFFVRVKKKKTAEGDKASAKAGLENAGIAEAALENAGYPEGGTEPEGTGKQRKMQKTASDRRLERISYAKFSRERRLPFQIATLIGKRQGEPVVVKRALHPSGKAHISGLKENQKLLASLYPRELLGVCPCRINEAGEAEFPFCRGKNLEQVLDGLVRKKDFANIRRLAEYLYEILKNARGVMPFVSSEEFEKLFGRVELPGEQFAAPVSNLDMLFANLIWSGETEARAGKEHTESGPAPSLQKQGSSLTLVDYEWVFDFMIPISYIYARSILLHGTLQTLPKEQLEELYGIAGIKPQEVALYYQMEVRFQQYVSGEDEIHVLSKVYPLMRTKNFLLEYWNTAQVYFPVRVLGILKEDPEKEEELYFGLHYFQEVQGTLKIKDTKRYQAFVLCPADADCILQLRKIRGNREPISLSSHNGELQLGEDYYFRKDPRMTVENRDYETLEFSYFLYHRNDSLISQVMDLRILEKELIRQLALSRQKPHHKVIRKTRELLNKKRNEGQ